MREHESDAPITTMRNRDGVLLNFRLDVQLCHMFGYRFVLQDPSLFVRKALLVFGASIALIPLLMMKATMPSSLYAIFLIVLHVAVLVVYFYRVRWQQLDADCKSLCARLLGLGISIWLLSVVSSAREGAFARILLKLFVLCFVHTLTLALLMVAVERRERGVVRLSQKPVTGCAVPVAEAGLDGGLPV